MSLQGVNEVLRGTVDSLCEASKKIGWDFDLTNFASPKVWQSVAKALGVKGGKKTVLKRNLPSGHTIKRNIWLWKAPGLRIETNANPMTGEKSMGGYNDPGWASYIYIEGDVAKVKKAASLISKKADYIKSDRKGEQMTARADRGQ